MFYLLALVLVAWLAGRLAMTFIVPRIPGIHVNTKSELPATIALALQVAGVGFCNFVIVPWLLAASFWTALGESPGQGTSLMKNGIILVVLICATLAYVAVRTLPLLSRNAITFDGWLPPLMGGLAIFVLQIIGFFIFNFLSGSLSNDPTVGSWREKVGL